MQAEAKSGGRSLWSGKQVGDPTAKTGQKVTPVYLLFRRIGRLVLRRCEDDDRLCLRKKLPDPHGAGSKILADFAFPIRALFRRRDDLDTKVGSEVGETFRHHILGKAFEARKPKIGTAN